MEMKYETPDISIIVASEDIFTTITSGTGDEWEEWENV